MFSFTVIGEWDECNFVGSLLSFTWGAKHPASTLFILENG